MIGIIVVMFKATEAGEPVDVRVFPGGDIDTAERLPANSAAVLSDTDFFVISQLLTIRKLEARGWQLRPSHAWEEAQS